MDLIRSLCTACDQLVEVGPGRVLSGLVAEINGPEGPVCLPVAETSMRIASLNKVVVRAFVSGVDVCWKELYAMRLVRPFIAPQDRVFIDNPCEERPFLIKTQGTNGSAKSDRCCSNLERSASADFDQLEELVLMFAAERTEFTREAISLESRLLDDLNLDSIKAAELVAAVTKTVGAAGRLDPSRLANATLAEVVQTIRAARNTNRVAPADSEFTEAVWVRDFAIEYVVE